MAPYQAVILAAGRGSRLAEHTHSCPKALLPIGPRSLQDPTPTNFLRRQVELLSELGVSQIVVVIGTLGQQIATEVQRWSVPVHLVLNPTEDMGGSGSLHSFQFAVRSPHGILDGYHQTLLMDADIVYDRRVLARFLTAPTASSLLLSRQHQQDDSEEVCVYGSEAAPRFLGKALTPMLVGDSPCLGEATGIVKFAPQDHPLVREAITWLVGDPDAPSDSRAQRGFGPAGVATEHEVLTQHLMHLQRMRCVSFGPELSFMECDDAREYDHVRGHFYPALLQQEAEPCDP